jgi:hypothetical protein
MNKKLTAENIEEQEADTLIEALGNCLELNNDFLDKYCSPEFAALIKTIPENDREYVLTGLTENHTFPGFPIGNNDADILLPCDEIEYQFEGKPEDVFENPSDFTIYGDLAYLYTGYGLAITYDNKELAEAIQSYFDNK